MARAAIAPTPEQSDHTSIKLRIEHWKSKTIESKPNQTVNNDETLQPKSLLPFAGNPREPMPPGIPFNLIDYIELLDWTGRQIRDDKRGAIANDAPPVLLRLGISPDHWVELSTNFESRFKGLVGSVQSVKDVCGLFGLTRTANMSNSQLLFSG